MALAAACNRLWQQQWTRSGYLSRPHYRRAAPQRRCALRSVATVGEGRYRPHEHATNADAATRPHEPAASFGGIERTFMSTNFDHSEKTNHLSFETIDRQVQKFDILAM